jgi:hypothetical protein
LFENSSPPLEVASQVPAKTRATAILNCKHILVLVLLFVCALCRLRYNR